MIVIDVIVFMIAGNIFSYYLVFGLACLITFIIAFAVYSTAKANKEKIMFDYILHDLNRDKYKVSYSNKSTGTISYIKDGSKIQISVYREYNSHANSKYWRK